MVGPCSSCGPYSQYCGHTSAASGNYYWPPMQQQQQQQYMMPNNNYNASSFDDDEADYMYSSSSSSSYSSVDCTLSLGTPSTRLTNESSAKPTPHRNSVSSFCWDLLHPKQSSSSSTPKPSRSSSNHAAAGAAAGDALFVRRCANCDTTSTPLWRNGPRGPKSLCNACGIRFKKEERRAAAATNTAAANNGGATGMMDPHHGYYHGTWAHQYGQGTPQKMQCFGAPSEFRFIEEDRGSDTSIQFLSWLTHDRPSGLVDDFTR